MALYWPVDAGITQQFGSNPNSIQPNGHTGMDFGLPTGTPVRAAGAGTVVFANWATTLSSNNPWWIAPAFAGITVVIDHGNGLLTLYAHLNETGLNAGDRVSQGQTIGLSGSTGLSTGPHLHFEVIGWPLQPYNGFYGRVNPNGFVSAGLAAQGSVTPSPGPKQRLVGGDNVNQRKLPDPNSDIVRVIDANSLEEFIGFVYGTAVAGINVWYKDDLGYAWAGGFTSQSTSNLPNLTPVAPSNRRKVGADNTNLRTLPSTSAAVVRVIAANTEEDFTGWTYGELIAGINIWYKDAQGYAWAGGFTTRSTDGIAFTTPPFGRISGTSIKFRSAPYADAALIDTLPTATYFSSFTEFVHGESIDGNDIWFRGTSRGGYAWSGGFTEHSTRGMTEVTAPPRETVPTPEPEPAPSVGYSFKKDFDFVEYAPAHASNVQQAADNPGVTVFPANPSHVVLHQFDAKDKKPSIAGVINHFQTERPGSESSAHFAVSGTRIVQLVSLKDRAYHAGKVGNDYIGIEVDPQEDAETIKSVKKLLAAIKAKYSYLPEKTRHGYEIPNVPGHGVPGNYTLCGTDIHLDLYELDTVVTPPVTEPPVEVPPVVVTPPVTANPTPITSAQERAIIERFLKYQLDNYFL
jgi:hypothetical protein